MRKLVYRISVIGYRKTVLFFSFLLFFSILHTPYYILPVYAQPADTNVNQCTRAGAPSCGQGQFPNNFIRICTQEGISDCSAKYTVVAWCDQDGCLDTRRPPEDKIKPEDWKGYGAVEQGSNLAPPDCLPKGQKNVFLQEGTCVPSANQAGGSSFSTMLGEVKAPPQLNALLGGSNDPDTEISRILSRAVELLYMGASLIFVLYFLWSSIEFIYSQGNKEQIAEARGRITWAIIGIFILALVFVVLKILSEVTGFKFFN